ncbi:hypothetical protein NMY22_g14271 [Coprinellus aureogranulatus]|nr:hypothetical protein NMY22_g14271 [Coprinellus aureogranulatus]
MSGACTPTLAGTPLSFSAMGTNLSVNNWRGVRRTDVGASVVLVVAPAHRLISLRSAPRDLLFLSCISRSDEAIEEFRNWYVARQAYPFVLPECVVSGLGFRSPLLFLGLCTTSQLLQSGTVLSGLLDSTSLAEPPEGRCADRLLDSLCLPARLCSLVRALSTSSSRYHTVPLGKDLLSSVASLDAQPCDARSMFPCVERSVRPLNPALTSEFLTTLLCTHWGLVRAFDPTLC